MRFLQMDDGDLVNADCIGRIVQIGEKPSRRFVAYDREGSRLGVLDWGFHPRLLDHVIPAAGQIYALCVSSYQDSDGTWETVADYALIVGWRFECDTPEPVLADEVVANTLIAIPAGEGIWSVPLDCSGTLEFLKAESLRRAKRDLDDKERRSQKAREAAA